MTLTQREREAAAVEHAVADWCPGVPYDAARGRIEIEVMRRVRVAGYGEESAASAGAFGVGFYEGSQLARVEAYSECAKLICDGCNAGAQVYENAERDYHVQADGVRAICLASPIRAKLAEAKEPSDA